MSEILTSPRAEEVAVDGNRRLTQLLWRWVSRVTAILRGGEPLRLASYTVARLPTASDWPRSIVIVTDASGGEVLAFSDGTDWRRVTDRAVVT